MEKTKLMGSVLLIAALSLVMLLPSCLAGCATPVPYLVQKDPATWQPIIGGAYAKFYYLCKTGNTISYAFKVSKLQPNTQYSLIYYADPWPGDNPGALLTTFTTNRFGGTIRFVHRGTGTLLFDLPHPCDANYPDGAKLWIVPSSDYDAATNKMTAWNPTEYLFEHSLITLTG